MALQYISDINGNHTAVIIPIDDWNNIIATLDDLKDFEKPEQAKRKLKLSDFVGSLSKETAQQMISDIEKSRETWERDI